MNTILRKDLRLHPYRIQVHQKLTQEDKSRRVKMAQWFEEHPAVLDWLWFTDEAHFWLSGHVNSRNAVHWGSSAPDKVLTKPLHAEKVTAWIGMRRGGGVIGPFFFEDQRGATVTINAQRYLDTALQSFWEELQTISADLQQEWFQQDGATPHTAAASRLWLQERFPGRVISLKEEVEWAPHSPDLSPLDFFLWGYLKDRVYKDKPRTSDQLKRAIIAEVSAMPSEMVDRAVDHLQTVRLPQVIRRGGAHIEHLL